MIPDSNYLKNRSGDTKVNGKGDFKCLQSEKSHAFPQVYSLIGKDSHSRGSGHGILSRKCSNASCVSTVKANTHWMTPFLRMCCVRGPGRGTTKGENPMDHHLSIKIKRSSSWFVMQCSGNCVEGPKAMALVLISACCW